MGTPSVSPVGSRPSSHRIYSRLSVPSLAMRANEALTRSANAASSRRSVIAYGSYDRKSPDDAEIPALRACGDVAGQQDVVGGEGVRLARDKHFVCGIQVGASTTLIGGETLSANRRITSALVVPVPTTTVRPARSR